MHRYARRHRTRQALSCLINIFNLPGNALLHLVLYTGRISAFCGLIPMYRTAVTSISPSTLQLPHIMGDSANDKWDVSV